MSECILITGSTGKIGKQLTRHFLGLGHAVVATTTSTQKLENFREELDVLGMNVENLHGLKVRFDQENALEIIEGFLKNSELKPTAVIHNARSLESLSINKNGETDPTHMYTEFQMAVVFPYQLTNLLKSIGSLRNVIFISSIYGVVGPNKTLYPDLDSSSPIQYGVSKAAQIHLTKELAVRLGDQGIRVNTVSFGGLKGRASEDFVDRYQKLTPMGGMLEEEDVIKPVDFLLGEGSVNMTGHNLIVDGGWTVW